MIRIKEYKITVIRNGWLIQGTENTKNSNDFNVPRIQIKNINNINKNDSSWQIYFDNVSWGYNSLQSMLKDWERIINLLMPDEKESKYGEF